MKKRIIAFILVLNICVLLGGAAYANNTKLLALTFDDGPAKTTTPLLLDGLAERNVHVTFFLVGSYIEYYPKLPARAFEEGHQLANHSYSHPWYTKIGVEQTKKELRQTNELLAGITGQSDFYARVPYGDFSKATKNAVAAPIIQWSVDPANGRMSAPEDKMTENLINNARDGSIIILHDTNEKNVRVALSSIDALLDEGYEFVTLEELFRLRGVVPQNGQVYYSVPGGEQASQFSEDDLADHWAAEEIKFARDKGILIGDGESLFPDSYLSRGMAASILWRMAGRPAAFVPTNSKASTHSGFEDVPDKAWFSEAVTWAHNMGYVSGISKKIFAPEENITKEQLYALLSRFAEAKLSAAQKVDTPAEYRDDVHISPWARDAVSRFRNAGFKSKNDPQIFRPKDFATRAEAAEMIFYTMGMK
ncbi:MAG: polysaccharide deacetylase family protein [Oscillospiraceae bacterium]